MSKIVVEAFKPLAGKEDELLQSLAVRLPLLRRLGLATDHPGLTLRAHDGTIIDVSEWVDENAIVSGRQAPELTELWQRFERCCDHVRLSCLPEAQHPFATFDSVELGSDLSTAVC